MTTIKVALAMADQGLQREGQPSGDLELILRKGNTIHYRTLLPKQFAKLITPGESFSNGAQAEWTLKGLNLDPDSLATLTLRSRTPLPLKQISLCTKVALPPTIRCDELGLSVSVSAHSDRSVPGPPTYSSNRNCLGWK